MCGTSKTQAVSIPSVMAASSAAYNSVEFKLSHPILSGLRMRLAIAHAIDKEALVKHVWYGFGKASIGPIRSTLKASYMRLAA